MFECGTPEGLGVPLMSASELFQAFQNQSLDMKILRCIALMGSPNISQMAHFLGKDRNRVKSHLHKLKAHGYVKDRSVFVRTPFNRLIRCHEYQLTRKGKCVLREGGLLFPTFPRDSLPHAQSRKSEPRSEEAAWLFLPRGASSSEINYQRAARAGDVLHAFSLARRASKSP